MPSAIPPGIHAQAMAQATRSRLAARSMDVMSGAWGAIQNAAAALGVGAGTAPDASTPLPAAVDPRDDQGNRLATPVQNQPAGDVRCTAYAVTAAMETAWCRENLTASGVPLLSVKDLFQKAQNQVVLAAAVGAAGDSIVDSVCFPDSAATPCGAPTASASAQFNRISKPMDQMIQAMCEALTSAPLVIAITLYENFDDFAGTGVYIPSGSSIGGHALCVVGYDNENAQGNWLVKNSYGMSWGDNGYGRIRWRDPYLEPELVVYSLSSLSHS